MLKHVILEGPDGGGKTRFLNRMRNHPKMHHFSRAVRASGSMVGPVDDLWAWHYEAFRAMQMSDDPLVFDRHPMISERIYAGLARNTVPQGKFADLMWVMEQRKLVSDHALLVLCIPPMHVVMANVYDGSSTQMPGVVDNIERIYHGYLDMMRDWPGVWMHWDYTFMDFDNFCLEMKLVLND